MVLVLLIMMSMAAFPVVVMVLMLLIMMSMAAFPVMVMVLVLLFGVLQHLTHHLRQAIRALYGLQHVLAVQLCQGCCDDRRLVIVLPNQRHAFLQLLLLHLVRPAQDNRPRICHLIDEEFPEISNIHLRLGGIHHRHGAVHLHIQIRRHILHRFQHIRQLPHARRLNEDALRRISLDDLLQRSAKIPHQGAADTAGIHFLDLDSRLFQESPVNADFTELVLNEHGLAALQGLFQKLLDQRRLPGAQKT